MNPLLRDMELFVEVAKHKSFTWAAKALSMYTSTLSKRIAALEKKMGVLLFCGIHGMWISPKAAACSWTGVA